MPKITFNNNKLKVVKTSYNYFNNLSTNVLENNCLKVIDLFSNNNKYLLDLGGFYGSIPLAFYKKFKAIYTYEADPTAINVLNQNLSVNNIKNVYIIEELLSDKDNEIKLFGGFKKFASSGTHIVNIENKINGYKYVELKSNTLITSLYKNNIDVSMISLIKMDIEGSEYPVIKHSKEFLINNNIPLYISIHKHLMNEASFCELIQILFEIYNYCYCFIGDKLILVNKDYVIENFKDMFLFTKDTII